MNLAEGQRSREQLNLVHDTLDELCGLLSVVIHGAYCEDMTVCVLPEPRHRHWLGRVEGDEVVTHLVCFERGAVLVPQDVEGDEAPAH